MLFSKLKNKTFIRLPKTMSEFSSGLVLFSVLFLAVIVWQFLRQPPPYEYRNLSYPANIQVCPGQRFPYSVDIYVNKTPVTIYRTETFFSENPEKVNNFDFDTYANVEIFNWDEKVKGHVHRENSVLFPIESSTGRNFGPGKYRYIVHLNSFAVRVPASISVPIEVPESCFK